MASIVKHCRMNEIEAKSLEVAVKEAGVSESAFIKQAIQGAIIGSVSPGKPDAQLEEVLASQQRLADQVACLRAEMSVLVTLFRDQG